MRRTAGRGEDGFILIESIAVLALSALVLLTLLLAADILTRGAAATARRANDLEILATGFSALRRDLENARYLRVGAGPNDPALFSGRSNAVGLAVRGGGGAEAADGGLIWIAADYKDERGVLTRSSARLLPQTAGFAEATFTDPALVMTGPWQYRFSYADGEDGVLRWVDNWTAPNRLPVAIRVAVLNANGTRQVAPPLVVRMHVDSDGRCPPSEPDCAGEVEEEVQDDDANQEDDVNQEDDFDEE